jgi:hypothetical protein
MVAASHFGIDYGVITNSTLIKNIEPVKTFAGPPPDAYQQQAYGFAGQFNGINSMVCKYLEFPSSYSLVANDGYRLLGWCSSLRRFHR